MLTFLIYEGKVAILMTVFYLFFRILLSKENLHRLNRCVLVSTVIASFILPFCIITFHKTMPVAQSQVIDISHGQDVVGIEATEAFNWWLVVAIAYFIGVAIAIAKIVSDIIKLRGLIRRGEHHSDSDGNVIIVLDEEISPISWMRYIFLSRDDYVRGCDFILEHERAHIRLGHARELLFVELLSSLQWFSPAMWYLKSDLKAVYEYEADDAVLSRGVDIKEYQYSLIRKAVSASGYSITNSFNHSILKNRITMMSKSNASRLRGLRALYILPLLCGALALNAKTVINYESSEISSIQQQPVRIDVKMENDQPVYYVNGEKMSLEELSEKVANLRKDNEFAVIQLVVNGNIKMESISDLREELRKLDSVNVEYKAVTLKEDTDVVPFQLVEVKPSFMGGDANAFSKWVNSQLVYPEEAKNAGTQGRVTLTFTVTETGEVADVRVLRGVDPLLDAEALRVVSSSPDWSPGKVKDSAVSVKYTFPVIFALRDSNAASNNQNDVGSIDEVNVIAYGIDNKPTKVPTTDEKAEQFSSLTKKPEFNGGDAAEFSKWINYQIRYPESAKAAGIQGRVTVSFKVNSNGKVSDVKVLKGICTALDEEAVRLVASSPDWTPGEINGKPVAVIYTFPVVFALR